MTVDEQGLASAIPKDRGPNAIARERLARLRLFRDPQVAASAAAACLQLAIEEIGGPTDRGCRGGWFGHQACQ